MKYNVICNNGTYDITCAYASGISDNSTMRDINAKVDYNNTWNRKQGNDATDRAYYDVSTDNGIIAAALQIARKTVSHTEYSTPTFTAINRDLDRATATLNNAIKSGNDSAADLFSILSGLSQDAADLVSNAYTGIIEQTANGGNALVYVDKESGAELVGAAAAYKRGYSAANTYLMKERRNHEREVSTEYIAESGGDIIALSKYVGRMLTNKDSYIPTTTEHIDAEQNARLSDMLSDVAVIVTPRQKRIMRLLSLGYSNTQIADKIGVKKQTVSFHLETIRRKAYTVIKASYPDLEQFVDMDALIIEREKNAQKRREQINKRGADYYRAYRARKRAERELQKRGGITTATAAAYDYNGGVFAVKNGGAAARSMDSATAAAYSAAAYSAAAISTELNAEQRREKLIRLIAFDDSIDNIINTATATTAALYRHIGKHETTVNDYKAYMDSWR